MIIHTDNPSDYKILGRIIQSFDEDVWDMLRFAIAVAGNVAKFDQNKALKAYLLSTGNAVLVNADPDDCIWGVKLAMDCPDIHNPMLWSGENLLGFALMEARDQLREKERRCHFSQRLHSVDVAEQRAVPDDTDRKCKSADIRYECFSQWIEDRNSSYRESALLILGENVKNDVLMKLVGWYQHDGDNPELTGDFKCLIVPQIPFDVVRNWECLYDVLDFGGHGFIDCSYDFVGEDRLLKGFLLYYWMYEPEIAEDYLDYIRTNYDEYKDDFSQDFVEYFADFCASLHEEHKNGSNEVSPM